jgi:hypothetical protein
MLLGRAWLSGRDGRVADSERALEASWRLNASYVERPEIRRPSSAGIRTGLLGSVEDAARRQS